MPGDSAVILHNLKRERARERGNATRFSALLDGFGDSTSLDDFLSNTEGVLKDTLDRIISLDDSTHYILPNDEYEEDIKACEEYIDRTKRAIHKANRRRDDGLSASIARLNIHGSTQPAASPCGFDHIFS